MFVVVVVSTETEELKGVWFASKVVLEVFKFVFENEMFYRLKCLKNLKAIGKFC